MYNKKKKEEEKVEEKLDSTIDEIAQLRKDQNEARRKAWQRNSES